MIYRILVVEDDPTIQRELVTLLQGDGYQAEAVTDFSAVVSTVRDRQPHLILLDIQPPGQSGFALCAQIQAFSNVPILFVTSSSSDMDELSSLLLGGRRVCHQALPHRHPPGPDRRPAEAGLPPPAGPRPHLAGGHPPPGPRPAHLPGGHRRPDPERAQDPGLPLPPRRDHLRPGDLVSYLWDNQVYVDDNALSVNIGRIREKLAGIGLTGFIQTKHRQGYLI